MNPALRLPVAITLLLLSGCITNANDPAGAALAGSGACGATVVPDPNPDWTPGLKEETVALFDDTVVIPMEIRFQTGEWKKFEEIWKDSRWEDPAAAAEWDKIKGGSYVHCEVTVDGSTTTDAACRPRGSTEKWYKEHKPQIKIKFNEWNKNARFRGLRALDLEFQRTSPVPIRDQLAMWLIRKAGLPGANVSHMRVSIDGLDRGIYQAIEPIDHEFLERRFPDGGGNLYEGGYLKKTNDANPGNCDMQAVNGLIAREPLRTDHAGFVAEFTRLVDVDQVLRAMAAESIFPTGDNLSNGSTNFYYYFRPGDTMVAIPWDLDGIFRDAAGQDPRFPLYVYEHSEESSMKLIALVPEIPTWKTRFEDTLVELRDGPLTDLVAEIDDRCALLRPEMATDADWLEENGMDDFEADCTEMKDFIAARKAYLREALGR